MGKIIGNGLTPEPSQAKSETDDDRQKSVVPDDDKKAAGEPQEDRPPLEASKIIGNG